ncbi:outer membrane beta-barrel protein [Mucilaginibacter sp. dw_454]|uniref:outer membrane beta-barrel protein n=1 Tax=Mucilaginibacter sp. dw_454 TaxID=2720079 RepID=UPI001BD543B0|nr:outer membrane beta-barrel protein [Mucilaginibacter sp. dw_454]
MYAQNNTSGIHGKVFGDKHLAAEAANVILLAADSAIIKSAPCDAAGEFSFNTKPGKYLLLITKIGYDQSLTGPYQVIQGQNLQIDDLTLTLHIPVLKEVSITAQRSYIEVKPDRVTLNVQNSIIADGNSVFEILSQSPGVHADSKGSISLIGHSNALVMLNGKPIHLTGQDLVDYLSSLPGNTVKQIELITSPSAKYDAAGAGVINIISRKGTATGTNFSVSGNAGYGKFGKAGGSVAFNSQHDKLNIFGNYSYIYNKTDHVFSVDRMIDFNNVKSDYDVNYNTNYQGPRQTYTLGADFAISKRHTIGVFLSGTLTDNEYTKNNHLAISNNGVLDSTILTKSNLSRGIHNYGYDLNYTGKLDTTGKVLTADVAFGNVGRHSSEYINNYFYNSANGVYRPDLKLQNLSPSTANIWSAKVDYVNPLSKTARLEAGAKYSMVQTNNQLIFGPQEDGIYTSDPNFSSSFKYRENVNSGYINYIGKAGDFGITAGLRVEQTNTMGNGNSITMVSNVAKHYLDWFPQIELSYRIDQKQSLDLSFNRGVDRPSFQAVNPFLYYTDLYDYNKGNPMLLPQYNNRAALSYTYDKYITTLYTSVTTNFFNFVDYIQNDSSKVSQSITQNFGKYSVYGLKFNVPATFTNWWDANFNLDASYQRIQAYPKHGTLDKGTQLFSFFSTQHFKLSETLSAEVAGDYESPTFYGIGMFKSDYWVRAGIAKRVLNNNGRISLDVSDIFDTHRDQSVVNYQNLDMNIYNKSETRVFRLSFTYRFGNVSLKTAARRKTGNEDEQRRVTNSGD